MDDQVPTEADSGSHRLVGDDVYSWLLLNADSIGATSKAQFDAADTFGAPSSTDIEGLGGDVLATTGTELGSLMADSSPAGASLTPGRAGSDPRWHGLGLSQPGGWAASAASAAPPAEPSPDSSGQGSMTSTRGSSRKRAARGGSRASEADARKRSRLEKNRESARESRRRKREYMGQLEARVQDLESENGSLRLQLQMGQESKLKEEEEKAVMCKKMKELVGAGGREQELADMIQTFGERYADYGKDRRSLLQYHIEQAERLLTPTQVTKMCMWSLQQPDEFYADEVREEDLPNGTIWHILTRELDITDEQKQHIKSHRDRIRKRARELRHSLNLVGELKAIANAKNEALDSDMEALQSVLTPKQIAKFILWTDTNPACMHMLNQLWNATTHTSGAAIASSSSAHPSHTGSVASSSSSDAIAAPPVSEATAVAAPTAVATAATAAAAVSSAATTE